MSITAHNFGRWSPLAFGLCILLAGCHQDMRQQPRYDSLEASDFFENDMSARPKVEGTVARGQLWEDDAFQTGRENGELVALPPVTVDRALLERGEERYRIYCSVCHSLVGDGNGMVVQRGFRRPPSYTIERLRNAPAGHFFDVMTNGFGAMPSFKTQVSPRDRWAIAAYIRVLQLSQNATLEDVPAERRDELETQPEAETENTPAAPAEGESL